MITGRLTRAALAGVASLVLLAGTGGVLARWWDVQDLGEATSLAAGGVALDAGAPVVHLHSRQPAGSRTYASGTPCSVPTGWMECRVVTSSLASERLISGDRLRVTAGFSLTASGTNLSGTLTVDARGILVPPASAFQAAAVLSASVTGPAGCAGTGTLVTCPVDLADGVGPGTYTAQVDLTTPPSNGASRWGTAHVDQALTLGIVRASFRQGDR